MASLIRTLRRWSRPRRGDWVPLIPIAYRWPILALLALSPLLVGIDYLMGEDERTLSLVERMAPVWLWGCIGVAAGLAIAVGYFMRWPRICIAGMWCSGAMFTTLGIGFGWATIDAYGTFRVPFLYLALGIASFFAAMGYLVQIEEKKS